MKAWFVGPEPHWVEANAKWLLAANLPDTPRCPETLAGSQCELIEGHECEHLLEVFPRAPESTPDQ